MFVYSMTFYTSVILFCIYTLSYNILHMYYIGIVEELPID